MESTLKLYPRTKKYDNTFAEEIRNKFLIKSLSSDKKTEIYNCAVKGDLTKLKSLFEEKHYPIMEECSSAGYFWTALHYAAHYGFIEVIKYIIDHYKYDKDKQKIINIQSNLGMTPLFIFLKSSSDTAKKKQILELFVRYDIIDFSICSKDGEDIFDFCKTSSILDYFLSILRED